MKTNKRWHKLDNAAKIFPPTATKSDPKVFRFACELVENVDKDILQKDGIKFKLVNGSTNLKEENSIIITLDQQYVAGYATIVFAP